MGSTTVDQAVRLVRQAVLQDSKRNYSEAARCYREAITSFRELRHSRASSKRLQELLDTKLGGFCLYLVVKRYREGAAWPHDSSFFALTNKCGYDCPTSKCDASRDTRVI